MEALSGHARWATGAGGWVQGRDGGGNGHAEAAPTEVWARGHQAETRERGGQNLRASLRLGGPGRDGQGGGGGAG